MRTPRSASHQQPPLACVHFGHQVRRTAIRWLGQIKDGDAVELLTRHLHDPDDTVRAAAASALARIGLGNLAELGKLALHDRALAVRLAGIELVAAAHDTARAKARVHDRAAVRRPRRRPRMRLAPTPASPSSPPVPQLVLIPVLDSEPVSGVVPAR